MNIIYFHHANRKKGNPPSQDDDLTELGYRDAELMAEMFKNEKNLKAIYTATSFRCKTTTNIINKYHNVPIIEDRRLEEFGTGVIEGETSWVDLQKRIMDIIKEIVYKYEENDCVAVVTSGVNIVGFLNVVYKLKPNKSAPFLSLPSCSPIIFNINKSHFE